MQLVKAVTGIYVREGDEVVASEPFDEEDLPQVLREEHELEEYDAEQVTVSAGELAEMAGVDVSAVYRLQVDAATQYTREKIREAGARDQLLVQAVRALDDLNEINNEVSERLRPWYRLHFPELEEEMEDNEAFAEQVAEQADRDRIEAYREMAGESTGMALNAEDVAMVQRFAAHLVDGFEMREELEAYVVSLAQAVVPNLSAVLGELLAARLVSEAGSLDRLAKMPSSTVQVLGAEKAMFRHMKGEGSSPKHGVLFMHPLVQQAAGERGKMARVIANKATIAARIDRYGGDFKGEELRAAVEETFKEVSG